MKTITISHKNKNYQAIIQPVYSIFADVPGYFITLGHCPIVKIIYETVGLHDKTCGYTVPDRNKIKWLGKSYKIVAIGDENPIDDTFREKHPNYALLRKQPESISKVLLGKIITLPE